MSRVDLPAIEGGAPVREEPLPFFRPSHGEAEIAAVVEALRSGWLTIGPRTQTFREAFLEHIGLEFGHPLNSCTSALFLALKILGVGPGDEVITTPNTFAASVNVIHHVGATPVLADIEPETRGLDPQRVAEAITDRTKCVMAVHYAGQPCHIEPIAKLCEERGLLLVEDAAHGFGAEAGGRAVGGFGDAGAFSFYVTKNLSMGEGGFITLRSARMQEEAALYSLHGMDSGAWKRYTDRGRWYYELQRFGYKFNMTDVQAALGLVQLGRAGELLAMRTRAAELYLELLAGEPALEMPRTRADALNSWHLFVPRIVDGSLRIDRNRFLDALTAEGISPSLHFIPVHHHPVHEEFFGDLRERLPESEAFYRGCFSLPLFPHITEAEIRQVCEALGKLLRHYRS